MSSLFFLLVACILPLQPTRKPPTRQPTRKPTRKPTNKPKPTCYDDHNYRCHGDHYKDCNWIRDNHKCNEHDNGKHIGKTYCKRSCDYCDYYHYGTGNNHNWPSDSGSHDYYYGSQDNDDDYYYSDDDDNGVWRAEVRTATKKIASLNNGENTDTAADVDVDADGYFSNNDREEATDEANEAIELEWEDSACSAHSQCSSLEGMCCPTTDGSYLGCCDSYLPGGNDNSDANNGGNDVTSTTVQDIVAETGDKATEVESESKDAAACLAHSKCSNLEGLCCPTVDGTYLGCCDSNSGHNNAKDSFSHQWDELEKKSYTKYHNEGWSSF